VHYPYIAEIFRSWIIFAADNIGRSSFTSYSDFLLVFHCNYMRNVYRYKHSAATNWNDLPYDIRDCSSVSVFKRKLKRHLFSIANSLLPSHVSPQRLRITFLLHMALYNFFILYCIVLYRCRDITIYCSKNLFFATHDNNKQINTVVYYRKAVKLQSVSQSVERLTGHGS